MNQTLASPYLGSPKAMLVMLLNYRFELVIIIDCTPNWGKGEVDITLSMPLGKMMW